MLLVAAAAPLGGRAGYRGEGRESLGFDILLGLGQMCYWVSLISTSISKYLATLTRHEYQGNLPFKHGMTKIPL